MFPWLEWYLRLDLKLLCIYRVGDHTDQSDLSTSFSPNTSSFVLGNLGPHKHVWLHSEPDPSTAPVKTPILLGPVSAEPVLWSAWLCAGTTEEATTDFKPALLSKGIHTKPFMITGYFWIDVSSFLRSVELQYLIWYCFLPVSNCFLKWQKMLSNLLCTLTNQVLTKETKGSLRDLATKDTISLCYPLGTYSNKNSEYLEENNLYLRRVS